MAQRPVFVPENGGRVVEVMVEFTWHAGMARSQRLLCVKSLHEAAASHGYDRLLEVSTKSENSIGVSLSALNLRLTLPGIGALPVECAFQGSKAFQSGGPYVDLYGVDALAAKRDQRLLNSGSLVKFELQGDSWPLEPKTAFYDWLYLQALVQNPKLSAQLESYSGFTDIEFNPKKSFSTQARSCALYVSLLRATALKRVLSNRDVFLQAVRQAYGSPPESQQLSLKLALSGCCGEPSC